MMLPSTKSGKDYILYESAHTVVRNFRCASCTHEQKHMLGKRLHIHRLKGMQIVRLRDN